MIILFILSPFIPFLLFVLMDYLIRLAHGQVSIGEAKRLREQERLQLETYLGIPVSDQDLDDPNFKFGVSVLMENEFD